MCCGNIDLRSTGCKGERIIYEKARLPTVQDGQLFTCSPDGNRERPKMIDVSALSWKKFPRSREVGMGLSNATR